MPDAVARMLRRCGVAGPLLGIVGGLLLGIVLAVTVPAAAARAQALQPVPAFKAPVVDQTGTLTPAQRQALEAELLAFQKRKGAQIAVLIVATTRPESVEQYGIRVAEAWKIGRRSAPARGSGAGPGAAIDDGVLLLVAKNDRRLRIEVGYGLEGAIPDGIAKRIMDESIAPRFRSQDWHGGIAAGIADLERRIDGESLPPPWNRDGPAAGEDLFARLAPLLLFGIVAGAVLSGFVGRFLGAGLSGIGSGIAGSVALGSMPLAIGLGAVVFVIVLLLGGSRRRLHSVGRRTYHDGPVILPGPWGGDGGFGRGGGFGGGGFGGGGGGGFSGGGGSFGGGGASGGW